MIHLQSPYQIIWPYQTMPVYEWDSGTTWSLHQINFYTSKECSKIEQKSERNSNKTNFRTVITSRNWKGTWGNSKLLSLYEYWICTQCMSQVTVIWTINCMLLILMLHREHGESRRVCIKEMHWKPTVSRCQTGKLMVHGIDDTIYS